MYVYIYIYIYGSRDICCPHFAQQCDFPQFYSKNGSKRNVHVFAFLTLSIMNFRSSCGGCEDLATKKLVAGEMLKIVAATLLLAGEMLKIAFLMCF